MQQLQPVATTAPPIAVPDAAGSRDGKARQKA
jgi:hypothetical protein